MKKQIFKNLLKGNTRVTSEAFTAVEKKKIYDVMLEKGMSGSTAYNRFFKDGFDAWEIKGIKSVLKEYISFSGEPINIEDESDMRSFYDSLERKAPFKQYMQEMGMCATIVIARFKGFNFKPWELEGMECIILNNLVDEE